MTTIGLGRKLSRRPWPLKTNGLGNGNPYVAFGLMETADGSKTKGTVLKVSKRKDHHETTGSIINQLSYNKELSPLAFYFWKDKNKKTILGNPALPRTPRCIPSHPSQRTPQVTMSILCSFISGLDEEIRKSVGQILFLPFNSNAQLAPRTVSPKGPGFFMAAK